MDPNGSQWSMDPNQASLLHCILCFELIYPFIFSMIYKQAFKWLSSWENLLYVNMKTKAWRVHGCQKIWAIQMPKIRKSGHSYTFFVKRGVYQIPGGAEKGLYGTHIRTMSYIGGTPPPPPPRITQVRVTISLSLSRRVPPLTYRRTRINR